MQTHPDPSLIALGIRQPWAELILRGVKTLEIRSQSTRVRGPIYVYASKKFSEHPAAADAARAHGLALDGLPRGVVVGTVEIQGCVRTSPRDVPAACVPAELLYGQWGWCLENPVRLAKPLPVRFLPYGVWFYPWRRRGQE